MKKCVTNTSLQAYDSLSKSYISQTQIEILEALRKIPFGHNSHGIAAFMGKKEEKVRKRLSELAELGLIEKTPFTLPSPSGRQASVWRAIKMQATECVHQISVEKHTPSCEAVGQTSLF